jgi:hypothetical protein
MKFVPRQKLVGTWNGLPDYGDLKVSEKIPKSSQTRLKYVYLVITRDRNLTVSSITQDYMSEFQAT